MWERLEAFETSSLDRSMLRQFERSLNIPYMLETATLSLTTTDLTRARLSYQGCKDAFHSHLPRTVPWLASSSEPF